MVYETGSGSPVDNQQGKWGGAYKMQPLKIKFANPCAQSVAQEVMSEHGQDMQILQIGWRQENDETNAKAFTVALTIDGVAYSKSLNLSHATNGSIILSFDPASHDLVYDLFSVTGGAGDEKVIGTLDAAFVNDIDLVITLTDAAGTNQNLYVWVMWGKRR